MPEPTASPISAAESLLGRVLVDQGLASEEEIQQCLALQRSDPSQRSLASVLVEQGVVTRRQLQRIKPLIEDKKPDQQIPGYKMLRKLGQGAMATVYLAKQISLDRLVAVKVLPKQYSNNPEWIERFYAEGRAAAKLNHPNIVGALDVGKAGEFHYFVMEYVEGKTAFDDLASGQKYTEQRALDIIIQVARALEHAHKAGFIHRDVKPKNIMITPAGVAKLADMGLARAVSDTAAAEAEAGKAYGTPYYISPEQIRGLKDVDFRADIYSLGATFYHLVTGQVPFDGPNPSAVMHKHLKSTLVPPDQINPTLSSGISEIIELCLAKNAAERYKSTSDLLEDLQAVARGEAPLQARRTFDFASLAALESKPASGETGEQDPADGVGSEAAPLTSQPLFWVAATGWLAACVLLIIAIVK